jgi:hypothetical protein
MICLVEKKYGKHKGWYVMHKKDVLSGPWVDYKTAKDVKSEWQFGSTQPLSDSEMWRNKRLADKAKFK